MFDATHDPIRSGFMGGLAALASRPHPHAVRGAAHAAVRVERAAWRVCDIHDTRNTQDRMSHESGYPEAVLDARAQMRSVFARPDRAPSGSSRWLVSGGSPPPAASIPDPDGPPRTARRP